MSDAKGPYDSGVAPDMSPLPVGLEHALALAAAHPEFREALANEPGAILEAARVELTPTELAILRATPDATLAQMIRQVDAGLTRPDRRHFLERAAAAVLVLASAGGLAACSSDDGKEYGKPKESPKPPSPPRRAAPPEPAPPEPAPPKPAPPKPAPPSQPTPTSPPAQAGTPTKPSMPAQPSMPARPSMPRRPRKPVRITGIRPKRPPGYGTMGCRVYYRPPMGGSRGKPAPTRPTPADQEGLFQSPQDPDDQD